MSQSRKPKPRIKGRQPAEEKELAGLVELARKTLYSALLLQALLDDQDTPAEARRFIEKTLKQERVAAGASARFARLLPQRVAALNAAAHQLAPCIRPKHQRRAQAVLKKSFRTAKRSKQ